MRAVDWTTLDQATQSALLTRPAIAASREQAGRVAEIIAAVRQEGDAALVHSHHCAGDTAQNATDRRHVKPEP